MDAGSRGLIGYYKLSRHYRWALGQVFDQMQFDQAIVLEGM